MHPAADPPSCGPVDRPGSDRALGRSRYLSRSLASEQRADVPDGNDPVGRAVSNRARARAAEDAVGPEGIQGHDRVRVQSASRTGGSVSPRARSWCALAPVPSPWGWPGFVLLGVRSEHRERHRPGWSEDPPVRAARSVLAVIEDGLLHLPLVRSSRPREARWGPTALPLNDQFGRDEIVSARLTVILHRQPSPRSRPTHSRSGSRPRHLRSSVLCGRPTGPPRFNCLAPPATVQRGPEGHGPQTSATTPARPVTRGYSLPEDPGSACVVGIYSPVAATALDPSKDVSAACLVS